MTNEQFKIDEIPNDFDDEVYYKLNPDVKESGMNARKHYIKFGKSEGRIYNLLTVLPSDLDAKFHINKNTKIPKFSSHENIWQWIKINQSKPGLRVLEIGSRCVSSDSLWKKIIPNCSYTGIDVIAGKNVTIVGDAHRLSNYFAPNSFDLVISFAVFEHLAMPWVVIEEISKVLAKNGHVVIETHFSFSEHELPWHFFQFNSNALEVLFCSELGYELIDSGLSSPIVGRFSKFAPQYLAGKHVTDLYCHSSIIVKKINDIEIKDAFNWRSILNRLFSESTYPVR